MVSVDPKLMSRIREAGKTGTVSAVLVLSRQEKSGKGDGPALERLIDRVAEQTHEKPLSVQTFPRIGAIVVRASGAFVQILLNQEGVASATIPDAEVTKA